ncbi:ferritin [Elusimicrobiota bacterium]
MVINEKILDSINKQINAELYSAYIYLSMSAYFDSINLVGFAGWMKAQAKEEVSHAMKFYDYMVKQGARILMDTIEKPQAEWSSPLDVFEYTYNHEQKVTGLINSMVELASSQQDTETVKFLNWYVDEQVEEEESASKIVAKIKAAGDDREALMLLDRELGQR